MTERIFANVIDEAYCELTCKEYRSPQTYWEPASYELDPIDLYIEGEKVPLEKHQAIVDRLMQGEPCR